LFQIEEAQMVVEEIMTPKPMTVAPTTTVRDVIAALQEIDARHLPVVEGSDLVGIVSDRDLREFTAPSLALLEHPAELAQKLARPVSAIMQSDVLTVDPEADVAEVVDLMVEQKVGAVPVLRAGTQELVGIVSYVDVLRVARDAL
jgi:acetoin utilization protein AcuB